MSIKSNSLSPNNATFLDTWAWILYKREEYADALIKIEECLKYSLTESYEILEHYGDILLKNGREEDAIEQWKKAQLAGNQSPELNDKINSISLVD